MPAGYRGAVEKYVRGVVRRYGIARGRADDGVKSLKAADESCRRRDGGIGVERGVTAVAST